MKTLKQTFRVLIPAVLMVLLPRAVDASPFGNTLSFDGINQYVAVTNFGNIIPTNEVTVEFWAYVNAVGS